MDSNKNRPCGSGSTNGWNGTKNLLNTSADNGRGSVVEVAAAVFVADDDNDDETEDEYCVYTYKGDSKGDQHLADLPMSFFKYDPSDSQPGPSCNIEKNRNSFDHSLTNGVHNTLRFQSINGQATNQSQSGDIFSPDMDFLEMDFDPGGNGEGEEDEDTDFSDDPDIQEQHISVNDITADSLGLESRKSNSSVPFYNSIGSITHKNLQTTQYNSKTTESAINVQRERIMKEQQHVTSTTPTSSLVHTAVQSPNVNACTVSNENVYPSNQNDYLSEQPHCSKSMLTKVLTGKSHSVATSSRVPMINRNSDFPVMDTFADEHQITLRLVKSNTLPELGAVKENSANENNINPAIKSDISNSAPMFFSEPNYFSSVITSKSFDDPVELAVRGVMIWTVEVAREKSIDQIGRSACGATAVLNILSALGFNDITPEIANQCVGTRLRAEDAELPEYLFSRWDAGATHEDLISGIHLASKGCVYGRFFHPPNSMSSEKFSKWLLQWICKGAVPVATRNMQINYSDPENIPDAWHHQMVFGMSSDELYMTNPIECVPIDFVLPQLSSPSTLLIRRHDVIGRKGHRTDLRKLARHSNPKWNEMNVLGQVANMFLEEMPVFNGSSVVKRVRSSHITIPARYVGGITLFIKRDSPSFELLVNAPDL